MSLTSWFCFYHFYGALVDSTRVHLSSNGDGGCDYINANYVQGAGDTVYISAQAPIPNTFGDFWRMVWEQKVHIVVMLTRLIEGGLPKAHKYWPVSKTRVYGGKYKVTLVDVEDSGYDYRIKEFELECDGERRRIFQFHFRGWPDHGVPNSPESLLRMSRVIDSTLDDLKERPFVEGPAPKPFNMARFLCSVSEDLSSLGSSCSGSVTSVGERRSLEEPEPLSAVSPGPYSIPRRSSSSQFTIPEGLVSSPAAPTSSSSPVSHTRHESAGTFLSTTDSLLSASTLATPASRSASQLGARHMRPGFPGSASNFTIPTSIPTLSENGSRDGSTHNDLSPPSLREFRSASPTSSPSDAWLGSSSSSAATASSLRSTNSSLTSNTASFTSVPMSASSSTSSHLSVPASHPFAAPAFTTPSPGAGSSSQASTASSTATTSPSNVGGPVPAPDRTGEYKVGPMLVHCSAGIGRSGAFIIIHSVLARLISSGKLSVGDISLYQLLEKMREHRAGLVPHQNQYDFCYSAIEHSIRVERIERELALGGGPSLLQAHGKTRQALKKSSLNRSSHMVPFISNDPPF